MMFGQRTTAAGDIHARTAYNASIAIILTGADMHSITVRGLDSHTKTLLRLRAAQHGCSMEQEVRHILQQALQSPEGGVGLNFAQRVQQRFQEAKLDDLPLPLPPRQASRAAPPLEP